MPVQDWTVSLANTLSVLVKGDIMTFYEYPSKVFTLTASGSDIGFDHPGNGTDDLYMALEDGEGGYRCRRQSGCDGGERHVVDAMG